MNNPNARRGILASLLGTLGIGVAACAACCAPPLLLAIGLLGASGAAGAILGWWLPIIGALMVAAAVLLLVLPKLRPRSRPQDNEPTGCGCPPKQDATPDVMVESDSGAGECPRSEPDTADTPSVRGPERARL